MTDLKIDNHTNTIISVSIQETTVINTMTGNIQIDLTENLAVAVKGLGITGHEVSQEVSTADHSVRAEDKTTGTASMKKSLPGVITLMMR